MGGGDVKLFGELLVGDDVLHVLRQALAHVVVYLVVGLIIADVGRGDEQGEDHQKHGENLAHALGKASHIGDQGLMPCPLQRLIKHQDQGRQDGHAAQHAQQHALSHDDAQVTAQREGHEAQGDEAGDGGGRTADDGGKGVVDGHRHGLLVVALQGQLLVVAVPQEDGVVHGHCQLQHGGQRLGDIGDLTEEEIAAQIEEDANADAGQKDEGNQPAVQQQHHGGAGTGHRQRHIDGLLLLAQILQVGDQRRHAGDEALLACDGANLPASMVTSSEVAESKNTAIMVAFPLLKAS